VTATSLSPADGTTTANQAVAWPVGTASIPSEIFNLIKLIVGAGVLGLPAGIAAFGDHPSALLPAFGLVVVIGAMAAYGFSLIGTVCAATQARSYRQAWSRTVGAASSWLPATACLLVTCCSVLCNSMIQADTIPAIVEAATGRTLSRTMALWTVTGTVLLPLCLLKELQSLAPFSLIGIFGMLYTSAAMTYRWWAGSYTTPGAPLAAALAPSRLPYFGQRGWQAAYSTNAAILVAMLSSCTFVVCVFAWVFRVSLDSRRRRRCKFVCVCLQYVTHTLFLYHSSSFTAFMAHYNGPKMYWELKDNALARFNTVVAASFAGAIVIMSTIALAGFGTFGGACDSMILNNYAVSDDLMSLSRVAVAVSLLFTFPLAFVGVREGVMDLFSVPASRRSQISDPLTVLLLALITSLAMVLKDIRLILSFGGATWGNCVIYGFPALMVLRGSRHFPALRPHVPTAALNGAVGLALALVGTTRALQSM
jgi:amino acid permease